MTAFNGLRYEVADGVALLVLERPAARNALDSALSGALCAALADAQDDDDVRVLVVTGAGPAFCAGLDLKEFAATGMPPRRASEAILAAGELSKPAIGAINGPVMTGGLELALGLDFLIASELAVFADTHASIGILPGGGMTARLPRAVGTRMARELSFTGRRIDAAEALRIGLVNRVVPQRDLLAVTFGIAREIAASDPVVVSQLKRLYDAGDATTAGEALAQEIHARDQRRAEGRALTPDS